MPPSHGLTTLSFAFIFLLPWATSAANDPVTEQWQRLIKADFPGGCVSRLDLYLSTVGANGARSGAWLVQTCEGNFEYGARYSPAALPADKKQISVSRKQKLDGLTPEQLERMYSL
ncbi:hypothetical protein [Pseudomonas putida]|uniref:hypothetical protein n=1 Tax=Pseudomonas putida TaxID=303 RepID=UPI0021F9110E|nr:hypothetical protein [Pseudomonas putida]